MRFLLTVCKEKTQSFEMTNVTFVCFLLLFIKDLLGGQKRVKKKKQEIVDRGTAFNYP